MRQKIVLGSFVAASLIFAAWGASAQMMDGSGLPAATDDHTAREEAEGKALWEQLQAKQMTCAGLQDEDFEALGEYFMGVMMGPSHSAMNQMMIQMMGDEGEEQMHLVMGKRLSGCDTSAAFSPQGLGFMPMMQMMWGGWPAPGSGPDSFGGRMMNWGNWGMGSFAWLGVIFAILWILWWVLVIAGVVVLIRWLLRWLRGERWGKSALDILQERYAKGEIDQREFEEKKRGLIS